MQETWVTSKSKNVKGKTHWLPVSGPDTVVQVEDGAEVVVQMVLVQTCSPKELQTHVLQSTVDTWPGVQLEEGAGVVVVVGDVVVVVIGVPQTLAVQTGSPSAPHTQVLHSSV